MIFLSNRVFSKWPHVELSAFKSVPSDSVNCINFVTSQKLDTSPKQTFRHGHKVDHLSEVWLYTKMWIRVQYRLFSF